MSNRSIKDWLSGGFTAVLVVCAIIITSLVVRRELFPDEAVVGGLSFYHDWEELAAFGNRVGPPVAPLQIVVFYDYECPFCRGVEPTIERLRSKYEDSLAVTYRHFILENIHLAAREAALAVD